MLEDLIVILRKRVRKLVVCVVVLSILLVGMTVFAFSEFEIGSKETTTYEVEYDSEVTDSDYNTITQVNDMSSNTNSSVNIIIICFAAIVCVFIITVGITIGIIVYGKSKNENKSCKKEKFYDKEKEKDVEWKD